MKLCHEAVDVADLVQEPPDHKDVAAPDDLSVVLGFTQMLSGGGNEVKVSRLATDHGWLDASGQLTAAGDQLARALLNGLVLRLVVEPARSCHGSSLQFLE